MVEPVQRNFVIIGTQGEVGARLTFILQQHKRKFSFHFMAIVYVMANLLLN